MLTMLLYELSSGMIKVNYFFLQSYLIILILLILSQWEPQFI